MSTPQNSRKRHKMTDEADGIVDYSMISLYEAQYDIFYNFRSIPGTPIPDATNGTTPVAPGESPVGDRDTASADQE
ncbi:MAG: hypothetical protein ACKO83_06405 [Roseiflexaceae bacterium]